MVVLKVQREAPEAQWHDLSYGVRLKLRYLTGPLSLAIEAEVSEEVVALRKGEAVLERYGFAPGDFGLLADPRISVGFVLFLRAVIRAKALIEDWNLTDELGHALPIDDVAISFLFERGPKPGGGSVLITEFTQLFEAPQQRRIAEGNVSGSSLNGSLAEEPTTARPATTSAKPAHQAAS